MIRSALRLSQNRIRQLNQLGAPSSPYFKIRLSTGKLLESLIYLIGHSFFSLIYLAALLISPLVAIAVAGLPFFAMWVIFFSSWNDAGWLVAAAIMYWVASIAFLAALIYFARILHGLEGLIYSHFRWGRGSEETCGCPACRQRAG